MTNEYQTYYKGDEEYVYLPFDSIIRPTAAAIFFNIDDAKVQWIPIAHIDMEDFDPEEDACVPVKVWFATNNGLI